MQFQIECNSLFLKQQQCVTCDRQFLMGEARVIACDEQGKCYGDICPDCISMGSSWVTNRFQQLNSKLSKNKHKNKNQVNATKSVLNQIA